MKLDELVRDILAAGCEIRIIPNEPPRVAVSSQQVTIELIRSDSIYKESVFFPHYYLGCGSHDPDRKKTIKKHLQIVWNDYITNNERGN